MAVCPARHRNGISRTVGYQHFGPGHWLRGHGWLASLQMAGVEGVTQITCFKMTHSEWHPPTAYVTPTDILCLAPVAKLFILISCPLSG